MENSLHLKLKKALEEFPYWDIKTFSNRNSDYFTRHASDFFLEFKYNYSEINNEKIEELSRSSSEEKSDNINYLDNKSKDSTENLKNTRISDGNITKSENLNDIVMKNKESPVLIQEKTEEFENDTKISASDKINHRKTGVEKIQIEKSLESPHSGNVGSIKCDDSISYPNKKVKIDEKNQKEILTEIKGFEENQIYTDIDKKNGEEYQNKFIYSQNFADEMKKYKEFGEKNESQGLDKKTNEIINVEVDKSKDEIIECLEVNNLSNESSLNTEINLNPKENFDDTEINLNSRENFYEEHHENLESTIEETQKEILTQDLLVHQQVLIENSVKISEEPSVNDNKIVQEPIKESHENKNDSHTTEISQSHKEKQLDHYQVSNLYQEKVQKIPEKGENPENSQGCCAKCIIL